MSTGSDGSSGKWARVQVDGMDNCAGYACARSNLAPDIDLSFFLSKTKFFWQANGIVHDGTQRTKFLVPVPEL